MKQQFFNNVSLDTQKLLDKVEELMSMDINHTQERLLWQVRFKLMEAGMFIKAAEDRGQPTLFDNMPPQENPNQRELFDLSYIHEGMFGTSDFACITPEGYLYVVDYNHGKGVVVAEEPLRPEEAKLPAIDDMRMAFKNYCQRNGNGKGKEALTRYGVGNLSELYSKGDSVVGQFYNSIV